MRSPVETGAFALAAASLCLSCQSAETRHCHELMTSAQGIVNAVVASDLESVERSKGAVELALDACNKAGRTGEVDQLTRAKNQLTGQAEYLKKRASQSTAKKLTPDELAALVKTGDPDCPKGQAYRPKDSNKEIRCTGLQIDEFGRKRAESYFANRGYKITKTDAPPTLKAEYGAELYTYTYASAEDDAPPKCVKIYPPPGMSWQEAAARATGVPPAKLEKDAKVHTSRGDVPLHVEDSDQKTIIAVGDCGG